MSGIPDSAPAGCALCADTAKLERSHIIPRFVFRALQQPDGPARKLLCGACEDRFSRDESSFARTVFHPLVAGSQLNARYGKWLLMFATSVCWRILEEHLATESPAARHAQGAARVASCRETWRQFLRGRRPDVGEHPIHFIRASSAAGREAIAGRVVANDGAPFVCARLGPVVLVGLVTDPHAGAWRGTRIHLEGRLKTRATFIPPAYRDYIL